MKTANLHLKFQMLLPTLTKAVKVSDRHVEIFTNGIVDLSRLIFRKELGSGLAITPDCL